MHLFSIIPFGAYELSICAIYMNCQRAQPGITWSNMTADLPYPTWWGIVWLAVDTVAYFLLFNAANHCEFAASPLPWKSNHKEAPLLKVANLSKTDSGEKEVVGLTDVTVSIKTGAIIVVIGPNGAGKSTIVNTVSGVIEPTSGELMYQHCGGSDFTVVQNSLGVVFQENVLVTRLSVRENLHLFGDVRGVEPAALEH
jgi:ABC-type multidrug transport system fused ATPase/permease subunit